MTAVRDFNTTVFDLVDELSVALPRLTEIQTGRLLMHAFLQGQPESPLLVDRFWEHAKDHKESIARRDADTIVSSLKTLVPTPSMVDRIWTSLSEENRTAMFDYISLLYDQAAGIKGGKPEAEGAPSSDPQQQQQQHLYVIYNNMWKEFLTGLGLTELVGRVDQLLQSKGEGSDVVHRIVYDSMRKVLPDVSISSSADPNGALALIIPPGDPLAVAESDKATLSEERFSLAGPGMSMSDFIDRILGEGGNAERAVYWHYIKLLTATLQNCPPELLVVMSGMSKELLASMPTPTPTQTAHA